MVVQLQQNREKLINDNNNKINNMPAFSMGKASKQPTFIQKNGNPGVGSYQTSMWNKTSRIKTSPSSSMPKTKKFFNPNESLQIKVGPGAYNPEKPQSKIMVSMKGRSVTNFNTSVPSPANYNTQIKFPTKNYSFGRSQRKFKTQQGPGPANYSVQIPQSSSVNTFGKQQRDRLQSQSIPGPGAYNSENPNLKKVQSQPFTFTKEKKFIVEQTEQKQKSKIPGPGSYSINDFRKKFRGGKFTQGQRSSLVDKNGGPGPSFYNPKQIQKSQPKATIGHQKRQTFKSQNTPGPGSYEMPKSEVFLKRGGTVCFTQASRLKTQGKYTPGPGSYESQKLIQSRAFSITSRHLQKNHDKIPGPQDYSPQYKVSKQRAGTTVFGSEDRLRKMKTQAPGPGQYKLDTKTYSKTFYFSKAKKIDKLGSTIGPGHYKIKPLIGMYDGCQKEDSKQILYV